MRRAGCELVVALLLLAAENAAGAPDSEAPAARSRETLVEDGAPVASPSPADTVFVLPPIDVGGRRPDLEDRPSAPKHSISREEWVRYSPGSVADAVAALAGVQVVRLGPWASRIGVRGLAGDRVLVLVDGIRLNDVRGHGPEPSLAGLEVLERIELLPGSSGAAYGANAMAGVVNLVTGNSLLDADPSLAVRLGASASEPEGANAQTAAVQMRSSRIGLEARGNRGELDGLVTPDGRVANSGDRHDGYALRGQAVFGFAALELQRSGSGAYDVGLPAFATASGGAGVFPLRSRDLFAAKLDAALARDVHARILADAQESETHFDETSVESVFVRNRFVATNRTLAQDRLRFESEGVRAALDVGAGPRAALVVEARREETGGPREELTSTYDRAGAFTGSEAASSESVPRSRRTTIASAATLEAMLGGCALDVAIRRDGVHAEADSTAQSRTAALDVRHDATTFEIGASRRFSHVAPFARYGTGFRTPNLDERYYNGFIHGSLYLYGNSRLEPEKSRTIEAGVRFAGATREPGPDRPRDARVSIYRTDVDQMISFRYVGMLYLIPRFQYFNVESARLEGIEADARLPLGRFDARLSGCLMRSEDRAAAAPLSDVGASAAALELALRVRRLGDGGAIGCRVRWRDATGAPDSTLARPAATTASLHVSGSCLGFRVIGAIRNLSNLSYREPMSFIPESGRTYSIALERSVTLPLSNRKP